MRGNTSLGLALRRRFFLDFNEVVRNHKLHARLFANFFLSIMDDRMILSNAVFIKRNHYYLQMGLIRIK